MKDVLAGEHQLQAALHLEEEHLLGESKDFVEEGGHRDEDEQRGDR